VGNPDPGWAFAFEFCKNPRMGIPRMRVVLRSTLPRVPSPQHPLVSSTASAFTIKLIGGMAGGRLPLPSWSEVMPRKKINRQTHHSYISVFFWEWSCYWKTGIANSKNVGPGGCHHGDFALETMTFSCLGLGAWQGRIGKIKLVQTWHHNFDQI